MTVLGGFLGAGKTTLLNRILSGAHGVRYAVLVNDFGELDVDGNLVAGARRGHPHLRQRLRLLLHGRRSGGRDRPPAGRGSAPGPDPRRGQRRRRSGSDRGHRDPPSRARPRSGGGHRRRRDAAFALRRPEIAGHPRAPARRGRSPRAEQVRSRPRRSARGDRIVDTRPRPRSARPHGRRGHSDGAAVRRAGGGSRARVTRGIPRVPDGPGGFCGHEHPHGRGGSCGSGCTLRTLAHCTGGDAGARHGASRACDGYEDTLGAIGHHAG